MCYKTGNFITANKNKERKKGKKGGKAGRRKKGGRKISLDRL